MIKPESLRAALVAALPVFQTNPDALKMWVDRGVIVARHGANPAQPGAFEYRYTLNLVVEGWQQHPSLIMLALNSWLAIHQPDLLSGHRDQSYTFEADIIDAATVDLSLELALSEAVRVTPRDGGGFDLLHLAEADPLLPDQEPLTQPAALLAQVWWQGERLIPGPPLPDPAD